MCRNRRGFLGVSNSAPVRGRALVGVPPQRKYPGTARSRTTMHRAHARPPHSLQKTLRRPLGFQQLFRLAGSVAEQTERPDSSPLSRMDRLDENVESVRINWNEYVECSVVFFHFFLGGCFF